MKNLTRRSFLARTGALAVSVPQPAFATQRKGYKMRFLIGFLGALVLGGCVSQGRQFDDSAVASFHKGRTTYAEVVSTMGPPLASATESNGELAIIYRYAHAYARPETYIPIIGPLVGGANATAKSVTFVFDRRRILQRTIQATAQTRTGH
jgi:outer membrane protein assembly factor BamE (lipoprotein component of BamABCDE complex)